MTDLPYEPPQRSWSIWKSAEISASLTKAEGVVSRDLDQAISEFKECLDSVDPLKILEGVCIGLSVLGEEYAKLSTFENSASYLDLIWDVFHNNPKTGVLESELMGMYLGCQARLLQRQGEVKSAALHALSALKYFRTGSNLSRIDEAYFLAGKTLVRSGQIGPGSEYLRSILLSSDSSKLRKKSAYLLADIALFRNEHNDDLKSIFAVMDDTEQNWFQVRKSILKKGDFKPLTKSFSVNGLNRTYDCALEAGLWLNISSSSRIRAKALKPESVRKMISRDNNDVSTNPLMEANNFISSLYDENTSTQDKLKLIDRYINRIGRLDSYVHELLATAATLRFLIQSKSFDVASYVLGRYQNLSHLLSEGQTQSLLNLFKKEELSEIKDYQKRFTSKALRPTEIKIEKLKKLPESAWQRSFVWTGLVFDLGILSGKYTIKKIFSKDQNLIEEFSNEFSKVFLKHISKTKGPIVKMAEMACILGIELPKSIHEKIEMIYNRNIYLPSQQIEKYFVEQLHKNPRDVFTEWDDTPIGAGCIAQVHKAKYRDNPVVVKIRYPGVYAATQSDLKLLKKIVPTLERIYPYHDIKSIFEESKQRMLEECQLHFEKEKLYRFQKNFADQSDVVVPKVYEELSSEGVLTMEELKGESLFSFCQHASFEEKVDVARTILKFQYDSLFQHGLVNIDPHPSNFLVLKDRKLGVLDLGFVAQIGKDRVEGFRELLSHTMANDYERFKEKMIAMGYPRCQNDDIAKFSFSKWRCEVAGPFLEDSFHVNRDFIENLRLLASPSTPKIGLKGDDYFIPRFWLQFYLTLALLDVEVDYRDLIPTFDNLVIQAS